MTSRFLLKSSRWLTPTSCANVRAQVLHNPKAAAERLRNSDSVPDVDGLCVAGCDGECEKANGIYIYKDKSGGVPRYWSVVDQWSIEVSKRGAGYM